MQDVNSHNHPRPPAAPAPWLLAFIYVLVAMAPLALGAAIGSRERSVAGELAVGLGLVALAMLLMQFISSGRYERVSGRAGMDRTLRFHQLTAYGLLLFSLLHPLLFVFPAELADWAALRELPERLGFMLAAPHLRSGVVALLLLILLVPLGVLRSRLPVPYEIWRSLHVLLAVGAATGVLHHAMMVGGYSQSPLLAGFWIVLGVSAMGSLAYAWLVRPLLLARAPYRVVANKRLGPEVCELQLAPVRAHTIHYRAGQFVWVSFGRWAVTVRDHPYSLASSPLEGDVLKLMIKARGDFSAKAGDIPVGTLAHVDGPHGSFVLTGRAAGTVALFAGGIGIAPILGVLRDLQLSGDQRPVRLVYGARNASRLVGRDVIEAAGTSLDLRVEYLLEEADAGWQGGRGGLSAEVFARTLAGWDAGHCLCMLCGPTGMMLAGERELLALGVPAANIVYERFEYD